MLSRIESVQGVGLLHSANGKPHTCHKATLVYADNARGKSTLAATLRSASIGNASLVNSFRTVDGTLPPKVVLQFDSGHKVVFENGAWSEFRPDLLVFDADFIGRNVHSGGAPSTENRKNLLEFALGEAAVLARAAVDKATIDSKAATDDVQGVVSDLSAHYQGLTFTQFEQLTQVPDVDTKIADLQKRIAAANNTAAILAKPIPEIIAMPQFDIEGLFGDLALSLKDIHADAEKVVKQHIAKLNKKGAESWLSQGQQFVAGKDCPFCSQDISENDLVRAYQTHFNAAYLELKSKVSALQRTVDVGTAVSVVDGVSSGVSLAAARASAWAEHAPLTAVTFDASAAGTALDTFRAFLDELVRKKVAAIAESFGSADEKAEALKLWQQVLAPVSAANTAIKQVESAINAYKILLAGDEVAQLQQKLLNLQAAKRRYDAEVVALFSKLAVARTNSGAADKLKKASRDSLDKLMTATLGKYQVSINALLKKFGASFSIKGMSANFRGNAPRTEYGLVLRGKDVVLEGGTPSFATALSDGDRRTLAFAFFVASAIGDPKLTDRVVIIDDPMCSLDRNRRHHSRAVLKELHAKAAQLVVLAHDAHFLRDLRDTLWKENKATLVAQFQLVAVHSNYTDFAHLDLDEECESAYARHHRLLNNFANDGKGDPMVVAKAIRPLLEGYLHRRFPGILPKDQLFGKVVIQIRDSQAPNPLCHAKNLVTPLNEINDYAGQFHHDTNPDSADAMSIAASELKTYVDRALSVVHKGAP